MWLVNWRCWFNTFQDQYNAALTDKKEFEEKLRQAEDSNKRLEAEKSQAVKQLTQENENEVAQLKGSDSSILVAYSIQLVFRTFFIIIWSTRPV